MYSGQGGKYLLTVKGEGFGQENKVWIWAKSRAGEQEIECVSGGLETVWSQEDCDEGGRKEEAVFGGSSRHCRAGSVDMKSVVVTWTAHVPRSACALRLVTRHL